jgi:quercetin dioxygenase-like cupin family protein
MLTWKIAAAVGVALGVAGVSMITSVILVPAIAQQAGTKRTLLRTIDFPPGFTTETSTFESLPGLCTARHTHPGIESGYLMEGDYLLKVDGKPDQKLKAGDSFETPPNTPHSGCTTAGFKKLSTYVVEKGKPLASPAPEHCRANR